MAISCQKCGRQYDVTLFQYGRTINCACGARVGFEHRLNLDPRNGLKFFADVNVARLVRWLRAAGIDTLWEDAIADDELVRRAIEEKRFVLTLDKRLAREFLADNIILLESENAREQFREIVARFKIKKPDRFFTRCLVCNTPLEKVESGEIAAEIPPNVLANHDRFYFCRNCEKVFWQGSHTRRMRQHLEQMFEIG